MLPNVRNLNFKAVSKNVKIVRSSVIWHSIAAIYTTVVFKLQQIC